jgi:hypothetical protein
MRILGSISCFVLLISGVAAASAQKALTAQTNAPSKVAAAPESRVAGYLYKGIGIGMTSDDVRKKLGDPKEKSDPQDLFVFNDEESAQFLYGPDKKITAIMLTFSGKMTGAPTAKDVFGEDVQAKPDGGISKMVRYEKAGYWVSYNKIVGDESIVSIAMQKMQ